MVNALRFLGALAALLCVLRLATPAPARTRFYYGLRRQWKKRWPFAFGSGVPSLLRPLLEPFSPTWTQVDAGIKMLLDPEDLISRVILGSGSWEPALWSAMEAHLKPGATFVDVGAHIGYFSLKASRVIGPAGRVISIEANPRTAKKLRENIQASGAEQVTVVEVACSDSETAVEIYSGADVNTGQGSLSKVNASSSGPAGASFRVHAKPLDAILRDNNVDRADVIKIDVEGAELLVLRGAEETLARLSPVLLLELDDNLLKSMGTTKADVVSFLADRGYSIGRTYDEANVAFYRTSGSGVTAQV